jgi:predicted porin
MKKSLLALAVLGAFTGVASAQSSVTLYGTIDLNGKYVKNDGSSRRYSMGQDGINSSQLGFKGTEDLGGGLKAGFVLLAGVNADTGTTNGKFFNRRSTVSLLGGFGEVRLGRDYTPTFWNDTIFDAFGTNGLGDSGHVLQLATGSFVRADNTFGYFLPSNIGGVYGQFMVAAGEGGGNSTAVNAGRYIGGRIGFAAGPFDIAGAYAQQTVVNLAGAKQKTWNIGGSYDFGVVKLLGYVDRDTINSLKETRYSLSAVVPVGQGEIHVGYDRSKSNGGLQPLASATNATAYAGGNNSINQIKAGYVYNLSKRTAVYTNVSRLKNGNNTQYSVSGGSTISALPTLGGKSTGAEFGVRHFF